MFLMLNMSVVLTYKIPFSKHINHLCRDELPIGLWDSHPVDGVIRLTPQQQLIDPINALLGPSADDYALTCL